MSTKLLRISSKTHATLKVMSTVHNTTMSNLLQFLLERYSVLFLSNYSNHKYSDSEILDLIECLLQRKDNNDQN